MTSWIPVPTYVCNDVACLIEDITWGGLQPTLSDWDDVFYNGNPGCILAAASNHGHMAIADWILKQETTIGRDELLEAMRQACLYGYFDIAKLLAANAKEPNYRKAMCYACTGGQLEIAEWAFVHVDNDTRIHTKSAMDEAMIAACRGREFELAEWTRTKGADCFHRVLQIASYHLDPRLLEWAWIHGDRFFGILAPEPLASSLTEQRFVECMIDSVLSVAKSARPSFKKRHIGYDKEPTCGLVQVPRMEHFFI